MRLGGKLGQKSPSHLVISSMDCENYYKFLYSKFDKYEILKFNIASYLVIFW